MNNLLAALVLAAIASCVKMQPTGSNTKEATDKAKRMELPYVESFNLDEEKRFGMDRPYVNAMEMDEEKRRFMENAFAKASELEDEKRNMKTRGSSWEERPLNLADGVEPEGAGVDEDEEAVERERLIRKFMYLLNLYREMNRRGPKGTRQ